MFLLTGFPSLRSSSLLTFREGIIPSLSTTIHIPNAGYATTTKTKGRKRPALSPAQMKDEALKKLLYPRLIGKPRVHPVGVHRKGVNRAIRRVMRSAEAHETISRAWQLHKRHVREAQSEEMRLKYESMKKAMDKLKELSPELHAVANQKVDPRGLGVDDAAEARALQGPAKKFYLSRIQGLFPREMRIPTDTPPKDGWNYEWKAPPSVAPNRGTS